MAYPSPETQKDWDKIKDTNKSTKPPRAKIQPYKYKTPEEYMGSPEYWSISPDEFKAMHPEGVRPRAPEETYQPPTQQPTEEQILKGDYLAGWDYTSGQPPPGETELPFGAVGWTPHGTPYYGDGIMGWLNEMKSKLTAPIGKEPEPFDKGPLYKISWHDLINMDPEERNKAFGESVEVLMGNADKVRQKLFAIGEEGEEPYTNPLSLLGRMVGVGIEGILDVFGEPAKKTEQFGEVASEIERMGEESPLPGRTTFQEMYERGKETLPEKVRPAAEVTARFMDWASNALPGNMNYNIIRASLSPKTLTEKMDDVERAYHAGRIAYTGIWDETIKQEYIRRYNAGENPYLLAMELENPLVEAAGQIVFDPLNLLGVGTRGVRDARRFASASDEFLKVAPEIDDYLRAVRAADETGIAGAIKGIPEAIKTAAARASWDKAKKVGLELDDFAKKQGLIVLTPEGKRFVTTQRFGELAGWIGTNHDPETALDLFKASMLLVSDDVDEIPIGMAIANKAKLPEAMYSRAGLEMGHILRKVTDGDPIKFVENLAKMAKDQPIDEVITTLGKKIDKVVEAMYPTIPEAIKAGKEVTPIHRAISQFHNMAQKPYRFVNNILSHVYMGMSPGYVARNFSTDTLTAIIDYGFGVVKKAPRKWAQNTIDWLGGHVPTGTRGFGPHAGIEGARTAWYSLGFKAAESMELKSAQRVIGHTVERTMLDMLKPGRALPDLKPLIDEGLDPKIARELARSIINYKGDVQAARKAFMEAKATGSIDTFKSLAWLAKEDEAALRAFNTIDNALYDKVLDAANQSTLEKAIAKLREIKENLLKMGDDVSGETATITNNSPMADDIKYLGDARIQGDVTDETVQIWTNKFQAMDNSNAMAKDFIFDVLKGAENEGKQIPDELRKSQYLIRAGGGELNVKGEAQAFKSKFIDEWYALMKSKVQKGDVSAKDAWAELVEKARNYLDISDVEVPNKDTFSSAFWDEFIMPGLDNYWKNYRDQLYDGARALQENFPTINSEVGFSELERAYGISKMFDDFTFSYLDKFKRARLIDAGLYDDAIRFIASRYNLPSVTEEGAKLDQYLLNIINKYGVGEGREGFKSLADIKDMDMARESFTLHKMKEAGLLEEGFDAAKVAEIRQAAAGMPKNVQTVSVADFTRMSSNNYPEAIKRKVQSAAGRMKSELLQGGMQPTLVEDTEGPQKFEKFWRKKSYNPDWYRELFGEEKLNRQTVLNALDKIASGKDEITGKAGQKTLTRIKDKILEDLMYGYTHELHGEFPPDPGVLLYLGKDDDAARALAQFMESPLAKEMTDTDWADIVGGDIDDFAYLLQRNAALEAGEEMPVRAVKEVVDERTIEDIEKQIADLRRELADVPLTETEKVMEGRKKIKELQKIIDEKERSVVPSELPTPPKPYDKGTPTLPRAIEEGRTGLNNLFNTLEEGFRENFGQTKDIVSTEGLTTAIDNFFKGAENGVAKARLMSANVANEARKFTLLSYPEKKNIDLALSYIFPYQFWYNRTYQNWLRRLAQTPDVIAGYAKYKEALAKIHAGAPDWWKYNINSYELFGIMPENPLFFNLEATLNPMNGLTGVDFDDKNRRKTWWTAMLADLNKFGPTVWTPFQIAAAVGMQMQGEEEAAARWGTRLIPQTATLKSLTHIMNIGPAGGVELDPNVHFFGGGIDPYELRRVNRAGAALIEEGAAPEADMLESLYNRTGPYWDMARERAQDLRAPGQLASFFLGVGFKGRTVSDITIDQFYGAYNRLWEMEPNMTSEEFRAAMDEMRVQYPFMDAMLLANKTGVWRDRAYAYNVMGRIPPGQKDDLAKAVNVDPDVLNKFWEDRGHIENWNETERDSFMNGIVQIGALLDIPDEATRTSWRNASNGYSKMATRMEGRFGEDIQNLIDFYYELKYSEDERERVKADDLLTTNPRLGQALDWQAGMVLNSPAMRPYYASQAKVRRYWKSVYYAELDNKYPDADEWQDVYYNQLIDSKERKAFGKASGLFDYWDEKADIDKKIEEVVVNTMKALPEGKPAVVRPGAVPETIGQEKVIEELTAPDNVYYEYTAQDWRRLVNSEPTWNLLMDHFMFDAEIPYTVEGNIEYLANRVGMDENQLLKLIEDSVTEGVAVR